MNKLCTEKRSKVIQSLVEGNSINSTVRMTGISKPTILKLIAEFGEVCWKFHCDTIHSIEAKRIQCDELWAFCGCKGRNVKPADKGEFGRGDVWTWTAIDPTSKLMLTWYIGTRGADSAHEFLADLACRIVGRPQLTTDSHRSYLSAVANIVWPQGVDYAQVHKLYASTMVAPGRYSPPICTGMEIKKKIGNPDEKHISTSHVERSNLTVRMGIRRYTRLTNGFSKKIENHVAMTTIFFCYYNFCRVHQTLRVTPAMEAKLTDHVWEIEELVSLIK